MSRKSSAFSKTLLTASDFKAKAVFFADASLVWRSERLLLVPGLNPASPLHAMFLYTLMRESSNVRQAHPREFEEGAGLTIEKKKNRVYHLSTVCFD